MELAQGLELLSHFGVRKPHCFYWIRHAKQSSLYCFPAAAVSLYVCAISALSSSIRVGVKEHEQARQAASFYISSGSVSYINIFIIDCRPIHICTQWTCSLFTVWSEGCGLCAAGIHGSVAFWDLRTSFFFYKRLLTLFFSENSWMNALPFSTLSWWNWAHPVPVHHQ